MNKKRSRSTDFFDQGAEGSFEPVVETPKSKFVPIENIPSKDLNPEEICILCEGLRKINDPEFAEMIEEMLATHSSHLLPPKEEEGNSQFPPLGSDRVQVAKIKSPGEVKPHRNGPSLVAVSMVSLLLDLSDYEIFVLDIDDKE